MKANGSNISVAIGMPDNGDLENIQMLMRIYEKKRPGELFAVATDSRKDIKYTRELGTVVDNTAANQGTTRRVMSMPVGFAQELYKAYPSFKTDMKHQRWFLRHFPIFNPNVV